MGYAALLTQLVPHPAEMLLLEVVVLLWLCYGVFCQDNDKPVSSLVAAKPEALADSLHASHERAPPPAAHAFRAMRS